MTGYVGHRTAVALTVAALVLSSAATAGSGEPACQDADGGGTIRLVDAPRTTVRIGVFGLFRPRELVVGPTQGGVLVIRAGSETLVLEGAERARFRVVGESVECATRQRAVSAPVVHASTRSQDPGRSDFVLSVPQKLERAFRGTLDVSVGRSALDARDSGPGTLVAVVTMDLETAVASTVAAESPAGAPLEALKAQAVVSRSYYVGARRRQRWFDFCDTTHCQFLRSPPARDDPAWVATAVTHGIILVHRGRPVAALYSASCGGRTHSLAEVGMQADGFAEGYPYFAVECPYCLRHARAWTCRIERVDRPDSGDGALLQAGVSSEAARLRMARKVGWNILPGGDYEVRSEGATLVLRGRGAGHGVGLCQVGARGMALAGATFREILSHYYPNTSLTDAWQ